MRDNLQDLRQETGKNRKEGKHDKKSSKKQAQRGRAEIPGIGAGHGFHSYMSKGLLHASWANEHAAGRESTGGAPPKKDAFVAPAEGTAMGTGIGRTVPVSVFKQCEQDWDSSGHPFNLKRLLKSYQEVGSEANICEGLRRGLPGKALFLRDYTGVGVHLLGMYLISEWESGSTLTDYEQVLWLPYNQLVAIYPGEHTKSDFSIKPADLMTLMGSTNAYDPIKKTLLVVTGIDKATHPSRHQEKRHAAILKRLPALFSELPCLMIGNYIPDVLSDLDMDTKNITLPSIYSAISQTYPYQGQEPNFLGCIGGEEVIDELSRLMRGVFYFHGKEAKEVVTFTEQSQGSVQEEARQWLGGYIQRVFPQHFRRTKSRSRSRASSSDSEGSLGIYDVPKRQSPWTDSEHLDILTDFNRAQGNPPCAMPDAIANPAQWYLAALGRGEESKSENDGFSTYHVDGHAMAVRISNRYVSDLGPSSELLPQPLTGKIRRRLSKLPQRVKEALTDAQAKLKDPDFVGGVAECFMGADGAYPSKAHQQAHELLKKAPKAALHSVMLTKESDMSYPAIQQKLLSSLGDLAEDEVTQAIENIVHGVDGPASSRELRDICRLMVSVLMFGEVAREEKCFFALFAMISLVQDPNFSYTWRRFVALPQQIAMHAMRSKSWKDYVLATAAGSLGGIHPMAHNGSYNQSYDSSPNGSLSWPEIKMQMLYLSFVTHWINRHHQGEFMSLQASMVLGVPDFSDLEGSCSSFESDLCFSSAFLSQPLLTRSFSEDSRATTPLSDGFELVQTRVMRSNSDPGRVEESSDIGRFAFSELSDNYMPHRASFFSEVGEDGFDSDVETEDTLDQIQGIDDGSDSDVETVDTLDQIHGNYDGSCFIS